MTRVLAALAAMAFLVGCTTAPTTPAPHWQLQWADEFDGPALDRSRWRPEVSCWGGGNQERQCYTDRTDNVRVEGGVLRLIARREPFTGPDRPPEIAETPNPQVTQPFTSGKVRTLGLAAWRYGRVEFRARVPRGQGTWPAVWMMPAGNVYGHWPRSGEIDILEAVNMGAPCPQCTGSDGENRTISALHFGDFRPRNRFLDTRVALPDGSQPADDFHIWSLEWAAGEMRFYLDGREYWRVTADRWSTAAPNAAGRPNAPFDQPFYLMANLAIGGRLAEDNNARGLADNVVPAEFQIDWIRVYQCAGGDSGGRACLGQTVEGQ